MINLNISSKVFNPVYRPYLNYTAPLEILYGGSSSGKSYFLADRLVLDMVKGGHNYLVLRKIAATLKRSVFNQVCKSISKLKLSAYFTTNKTDMIITCTNGYQILFGGMKDEGEREKIKSITPAKGVLTDIWVNSMAHIKPL